MFRNCCLNYNRYDCALVFYKRSVKRKVKYEEREVLKLSLKSELNLTHLRRVNFASAENPHPFAYSVFNRSISSPLPHCTDKWFLTIYSIN